MAIRHMFYLSRVHLKELFRTPIFYAYLCLFFVYYYKLSTQTVLLQQEVGIQVNAWGYAVGVFSNYQSTLVFGLGGVMLFSDLPLIRNNALFETTRCSRDVWAGGRILYVVFVSVFYTLFMLLMCLLTCRGSLVELNGWGKLLNTIANGYTFGSYTMPIELSLSVTGMFSPFQAFCITAIMCILSSMVLGLTILSLSLCLGRMAALFCASLLAVFDFLIYLKLPFWWYHLSPLSFTRLSVISNPDMPYYPTMKEAVYALIAVNIALTFVSILLSHLHQRFSNQILREQY